MSLKTFHYSEKPRFSAEVLDTLTTLIYRRHCVLANTATELLTELCEIFISKRRECFCK